MNPPFTVYHVALQFGRMFSGSPVFRAKAAGFCVEGIDPLISEEVYAKAEAIAKTTWKDNVPAAQTLVNGEFSDWQQMWGREYTTTVFK